MVNAIQCNYGQLMHNTKVAQETHKQSKQNKLQKLEDALVEQMLTSAKYTKLWKMRKGV